jgi:hypothetical protein
MLRDYYRLGQDGRAMLTDQSKLAQFAMKLQTYMARSYSEIKTTEER